VLSAENTLHPAKVKNFRVHAQAEKPNGSNATRVTPGDIQITEGIVYKNTLNYEKDRPGHGQEEKRMLF